MGVKCHVVGALCVVLVEGTGRHQGRRIQSSLSGFAHAQLFCFSRVLGITITLIILNANGIYQCPALYYPLVLHRSQNKIKTSYHRTKAVQELALGPPTRPHPASLGPHVLALHHSSSYPGLETPRCIQLFPTPKAPSVCDSLPLFVQVSKDLLFQDLILVSSLL